MQITDKYGNNYDFDSSLDAANTIAILRKNVSHERRRCQRLVISLEKYTNMNFIQRLFFLFNPEKAKEKFINEKVKKA